MAAFRRSTVLDGMPGLVRVWQPTPQIPAEPPPPPPQDNDAWRHGGGGWRGPHLSLVHIVIGAIVVLIAVSFASCLLVRAATPGFESVIVNPQDGSSHEPGPILLRIRTNQAASWELSYRHPGSPNQWEVIDQGSGDVMPTGRAGATQGSRLVPAQQPGEYTFRLVAQNGEGEEAVDTATVTVR